VKWQKLLFQDENYFFVPKDFRLAEKYERGFKIDELFHNGSVGISTSKDSVNIWNTQEEVKRMLNDLHNLPEEEFRTRYNVGADSRDWSIARAKADVGIHIDENKIIPISYRPFDAKFLYYTGLTNGIVARPRFRSLGLMLSGQNLGLIVPRQTTQDWRHVFISNKIIDGNFTSSARLLGAGQLFPLYTNGGKAAAKIFNDPVPNLDPKIIEKIAKAIGLEFEAEKSNNTDKFAPIDLLDYIYAMLHSPAYREKYKEFLKINFPRVPYPESAEQFRWLAAIGSELRCVHLMEHPDLSKLITQYPVAGNNTVEKLRWELVSPATDNALEDISPDGVNRSAGSPTVGRVWINSEQYFDNVPLAAWEFYIGGYQPAQKWLKDRNGRTLTYDDIMHYQRIIKALAMTDELMNSIDEDN
jgi:predicted helicase